MRDISNSTLKQKKIFLNNNEGMVFYLLHFYVITDLLKITLSGRFCRWVKGFFCVYDIKWNKNRNWVTIYRIRKAIHCGCYIDEGVLLHFEVCFGHRMNIQKIVFIWYYEAEVNEEINCIFIRFDKNWSERKETLFKVNFDIVIL